MLEGGTDSTDSEPEEAPEALPEGVLDPSDLEEHEELFREMYGELHKLARLHMARQGDGHTLQPTALVNEAYLRLRHKGADWRDRRHFFRLASRVMRQVLIDHARHNDAAKRVAPGDRIDLDELVYRFEERGGDLLELDAVLEVLEERDPEMVRLVELRFFGGRSMKEAADILGLPERTVGRRWQVAKRLLRQELSK